MPKKAARKKMPHARKASPGDQADARFEADELERVIAHLDTLYERGDDCCHPDSGMLITDGEYDAMRRRLQVLRPKSKVFESATASQAISSVQKVKHDPPMTSIEKASHEDVATQEEMLLKWIVGCRQAASDLVLEGQQEQIDGKLYKGEPVEFPVGYFYMAYKLDGVALALYYQDGHLIRAGLRPRDGINGEDVTEQVKFVSGIPERLAQSHTCSIRGELICLLSDFERVQTSLADVGEKLRANPRNHAAGGIRQFKNPSKTEMMRLSFVAYGIEAFDNPPFRTELERAEFCRESLGVPYIDTKRFEFEELAKMEARIPQLDFEVDGVIVGVDRLEDQEQLGRHGDPRTGNPKGKIAWKFREEEATPTIREIEWQTGRTGKVVAVAVFDAVRLAGTNVSRATLHNAGFMERNQITIGSKISVRKAGKIIPKVTGVLSGQGQPQFPPQCPSCGHDTELVAGGSPDMLELVCHNPNCAAQNVSGLCHYLETFGVLGLGESRVSSLVEGGQISIPADFYELEVEQAEACGLTLRQSLLAIAAIHMISAPDKLDNERLEEMIATARETKKSVPLSQLFAAFGIEAAGKAAGKALASHFGSFEKIRAASVEQLEEVEDVGEKTAKTIHAYLHSHSSEIDRLLQYVEPTSPRTGKLSGMSFCFSGSFAEGKRHWEKRVEELGAKCTSSVSKKLSYLVAGPGSGSKTEKAEKLGIEILTVESLQQLL